MRKSAIFGLSALIATFSVGCGGEPLTPTTPTATTATPPPTTSAVVAEPAPAPEPAETVALVHWKSFDASVSGLSTCAGIPSELSGVFTKTLVDEALKDGLRGVADTKAMSQLIASDAPMDAIVSLDPQKKGKGMVGFAVGLKNLEQAKAAAAAVSPTPEITQGIWRIGDKESHKPACAIATSVGSTPARLVCTERDSQLLQLAPYLARTAPNLTPKGGDLHAEVRFSTLAARFGDEAKSQLRGFGTIAQSQIAIGEPLFDKAAGDAAAAIQGELAAWIGDLDNATIDITADSTRCLSASVGIGFKGTSSWLASTVGDRADRAGAPPAIYWRAPKDADQAMFGRATDPSKMAPIIKNLKQLIEGALNKVNAGTPAERHAVADLIDMNLSKDTNTVSASGRGESAPLKAKASAQEKADHYVESLIGWTVIGMDQPADPTIKWARDFVKLAGSNTLFSGLRKELGKNASFIPKLKIDKAPAALGKDAIDVVITADGLPLPKELGGDSGPKAPKMKVSVHILVMPDGKNTWIAVGPKLDVLVAHLQMVKAGAPDSGTLASRPGLEALKGGKNMAGGFITMERFVKALTMNLENKNMQDPDLQKIKTVVGMMPHKGETPMFITTQVTGGSAPTVKLTFDVQRGTVEDLGAAIKGIMAFKN
jgi:hypothetical protein